MNLTERILYLLKNETMTMREASEARSSLHMEGQ